MPSSPAGESVISRVVRLVDAFDREVPWMSLTELARRAGLPQTTAHRPVKELLRRGLIERASDDERRMGLRRWGGRARFPGAHPARDRAAVRGGRAGRGAPAHHSGGAQLRDGALPGAPLRPEGGPGRAARRATDAHPRHVPRAGPAHALPAPAPEGGPGRAAGEGDAGDHHGPADHPQAPRGDPPAGLRGAAGHRGHGADRHRRSGLRAPRGPHRSAAPRAGPPRSPVRTGASRSAGSGDPGSVTARVPARTRTGSVRHGEDTGPVTGRPAGGAPTRREPP